MDFPFFVGIFAIHSLFNAVLKSCTILRLFFHVFYSLFVPSFLMKSDNCRLWGVPGHWKLILTGCMEVTLGIFYAICLFYSWSGYVISTVVDNMLTPFQFRTARIDIMGNSGTVLSGTRILALFKTNHAFQWTGHAFMVKSDQGLDGSVAVIKAFRHTAIVT